MLKLIIDDKLLEDDTVKNLKSDTFRSFDEINKLLADYGWSSPAVFLDKPYFHPKILGHRFVVYYSLQLDMWAVDRFGSENDYAITYTKASELDVVLSTLEQICR